MIGAIAGDIIGSRFERKNLKSVDFELFSKFSKFTDDTVLTVAVADVLLNGKDYTETLQEYGKRYFKRGFGGRFLKWIETENPEPYNSWGNGSAMRVSAVGWLIDNEVDVAQEARKSAEVTHNHPEGIKGAQAVAEAIFAARMGASKADIKNYIETEFGYDLSRKLDDIRPTYKFHVSCQKSVPESIIAFLESHDFESAVRLGISIGGDSDTIACVAGSIAEAYYKEIPTTILQEVKQRLSPELLEIVSQFQMKYLENHADYKSILP